MVFLLETLVWQKAFDPKKKAAHMAAKPKLYMPEFMKQKNKLKEGIAKDVVALDIDQVKEILARPRG